MIAFFQIIHIIVCFILIAIVLIQTGKGQGLAGTFGSMAGDTAQNLFGARTGDVLTKVTTWVCIIFFGMALMLAVMQSRASRSVLTDYNPSPDAQVATSVAEALRNALPDSSPAGDSSTEPESKPVLETTTQEIGDSPSMETEKPSSKGEGTSEPTAETTSGTASFDGTKNS